MANDSQTAPANPGSQPPQPGSSNSQAQPAPSSNRSLWIALIATLFGLVAATLGPISFIHVFDHGPSGDAGASEALANSVIPLSVMAFAGVVGLLAFLALIAFTFAALGLSDPGQALGLPEGSIRAVIALSLIVTFVISSLFLFGRLSNGQTITLKGLTEAQVKQIPGDEIVSKELESPQPKAAKPALAKATNPAQTTPASLPSAGTPPVATPSTGAPRASATPARPENTAPAASADAGQAVADAETPKEKPEPTYTVVRRLGPTRAGEDFSKQLLTTISTLVVAIASFYFGSKAVSSGQSAMTAMLNQKPDNGGDSGATSSNTKTPPDASTANKPDAQTDQTNAADAAKSATGGQTSPDANQPSGPASGPPPQAQPALAPGDPQLALLLSKRVHAGDAPASSATLEVGADGKLISKENAPDPAAAAPHIASVGEIDSDHWLTNAKREPIGQGAELKPIFLVIHYTEGYSADSSVSSWRSANNNILAHVVVDRDGTIFQCRPFNQKCWHAGASRICHPVTGQLYHGLNDFSIGIEIANIGDGGDARLQNRLQKYFPNAQLTTAHHRNESIPGSDAAETRRTQWEVFPEAQINSVFALAKLLIARYQLVDITGHDCIAYERKNDPGPAFPMAELRKANGLTGLPPVWNAQGKKFDV